MAHGIACTSMSIERALDTLAGLAGRSAIHTGGTVPHLLRHLLETLLLPPGICCSRVAHEVASLSSNWPSSEARASLAEPGDKGLGLGSDGLCANEEAAISRHFLWLCIMQSGDVWCRVCNR